jgi:hypothetical protein
MTKQPTLPALAEDAHGIQPYSGPDRPLPDLRETLMLQIADPKTPMELRERALAMIERVQDRWAKQQFDRAMAEIRPKLPVIRKNGLIVRPATTKYPKGSTTPFARWDDVYKACMPLLDEHGFTCSFSSDLQGSNALKVTMTVHHSAGHSESGSLVVPWLDAGGSKSPAQEAASSFTLAQRHAFIKFFNILTEDKDDDGTGKGVPERITEEQIRKIEDMLQAIERNAPGNRARVMKWIKTEHRAEALKDLFQGDQLKSVNLMLKSRAEGLGILQ